MSKEKPIKEGYQPEKRGYQPVQKPTLPKPTTGSIVTGGYKPEIGQGGTQGKPPKKQ